MANPLAELRAPCGCPGPDFCAVSGAPGGLTAASTVSPWGRELGVHPPNAGGTGKPANHSQMSQPVDANTRAKFVCTVWLPGHGFRRRKGGSRGACRHQYDQPAASLLSRAPAERAGTCGFALAHLACRKAAARAVTRLGIEEFNDLFGSIRIDSGQGKIYISDLLASIRPARVTLPGKITEPRAQAQITALRLRCRAPSTRAAGGRVVQR